MLATNKGKISNKMQIENLRDIFKKINIQHAF